MKIGRGRRGTILAAHMSFDHAPVGEDGAKSTTNRGNGAQEKCFMPTGGAPGGCSEHYRVGGRTCRRRTHGPGSQLASPPALGSDRARVVCTGASRTLHPRGEQGGGTARRAPLSPSPWWRSPRNAGHGARTAASRQRAARRCNDRPLPHPRCRRRQSVASCPRNAGPTSANRRVRP